jgi:cysteine dioxygenase
MLYKKFHLPFNISIIRWNPLVSTPIHKHNNKECNFLVIKGRLQESIYNKLEERGYDMITQKTLSVNQSSHINDSIGYHSIKNLSDEYSWSIHYYK